MTWIQTIDGGCVNASFVIRIERTDDDGSTLHMTDGTIVRSNAIFKVIRGELVEVTPIDDDDSDCPF
ncbi:hypothetical protein [Bradyrhizobium sp. AS23.2]|uniref:hypothetical protein n=1 Tax=Bradyrhizobium sp. AS23.2 TaxID=1680155 RepID=UPI00093E755F|nr:hypothetical protein [Bradyrhizobium sp. AS23.2]OKO76047.1 hypothetical protein AC630_23705 [Bradyrhizobium sp. AS23.2]